jgi:hypothetical protein
MSWGSIRENNTFRTSQRAKRERGTINGAPTFFGRRKQLFVMSVNGVGGLATGVRCKPCAKLFT